MIMAKTSDISDNIIKQTVKRALEEVLIEKSFKEKTNESQNKLWDKDKLILIFYIGIGGLSQQKAYEIFQNISHEIDNMFDEIEKEINKSTISVEHISSSMQESAALQELNTMTANVKENTENAVNKAQEGLALANSIENESLEIHKHTIKSKEIIENIGG